MSTRAAAAPRALVLCGTGRYADRWHPFEETSEALARLLADAGCRVEVSTTIAERMTQLDGIDLLVANAAGPDPELDSVELAAAERSLDDYVRRGGAVMALHVGVTTLLGLPQWPETTGARWNPGSSMHPRLSIARVYPNQLSELPHGVRDFDVEDERYCFLHLAPGSRVLLEHCHEGRRHPLMWIRTHRSSRVFADCLGHDARSFRAPEHQILIRRATQWLLAA